MYVLIYCIRTFFNYHQKKSSSRLLSSLTPNEWNSTQTRPLKHHYKNDSSYRNVQIFSPFYCNKNFERRLITRCVEEIKKIMINKKMIDIVAHHHKLHSSTHHMTYIKKTFKNIYQSRRIRRRCFPVVSEVISSNEDLNHPREAMQK